MIKFFKKTKNIFFGNSLVQRLFQGYLVSIIIGAILLVLPITGTEPTKLVDAIFISASAFSDTGLTTIDISTHFNFFGQLIILLLIQIGGIGLMTIKILALLFIGKKINYKERMFGSSERGNGKIGGSIELIQTSMIVIFSTEIIAAIIFAIRFATNYSDLFSSTGELIWSAIFHSISSVNNAGFDILPGDGSLDLFAKDYLIQIVVMICLIIGGIGFPVFYDLKKWIIAKIHKESYRVSLFTRFSVKSYIFVGILGLVLVFVSELCACKTGENVGILYDSQYTMTQRIFYIVFNTISTRNAGFCTIDLNEFSESSILIFTILMWIGAAPSSTGGGIRCTTFLIVCLLIKSVAKGSKDVESFDRRIPKETVNRSLSVSITSIIVMVTFTLILLIINTNNADFTNTKVLFEVTSSFGTTGLSLGITSQLNGLSKILLTLVMFIGQVGISSSLLIWMDKKVGSNYRVLPEEDVTIG